MKRLPLLAVSLATLWCASLHAAPLDIDRAEAEMTRWEGHKLLPYRDGTGWSVGVGHSLTAHGEPMKASYTRAEVYQLFIRDYAVALEAARASVEGFDDLPEDVKLVVIGLVWTTGPSGFMRFKDFRRSLSHRAYTTACTALYLSRWYQQVSAQRANHAINILRAQ